MIKTKYHISKMDCPSEENIIRMKLDSIEHIKKLDFDIEKRSLIVYHLNKDRNILSELESLKFGTKYIDTEIVKEGQFSEEKHQLQSKLLWTVLWINLAFFIIEITGGYISKSMGLVADSLDMLADSFVYGLSLWAVGSTMLRKKKVARLSGYFQIALAVLGIVEIIRRFIGSEAMPDYRIMIGVSILALIANGICLYLFQKSKSKEAHMKASMIFTSNDIIINAGVILAGILVLLTQSKYPDLIVGIFVFLIVIKGAFRILKLGK